MGIPHQISTHRCRHPAGCTAAAVEFDRVIVHEQPQAGVQRLRTISSPTEASSSGMTVDRMNAGRAQVLQTFKIWPPDRQE